jgi:hypothetical protein
MAGVRLRVLSLGAGVQSTTLALMAAHGEIGPTPDLAIFADTGDEPGPVYEHLTWLSTAGVLPFSVKVTSKGAPLGDAQFTDNEARVPWHTASGMRQRQCTKNWKIRVVRRAIRDALGVGPRDYLAPGSVEEWVGISTDEAFRVSPSRVRFIHRRDPLIEKRMSRSDCYQWLRRHGYPIPPKSSCVFCPYRSNEQWRDLRTNDPTGWQRAIEIDRRLREAEGLAMFRRPVFAHRSLMPLGEVDLSTPEDRGQLNLFVNECEGMCGV